MDQARPFFSIIILYWNNSQTIQRCLEALNAQTDKDFEILLVDNGSDDPFSSKFIPASPALSVQIDRLEYNTGFAGGNNLAATKARGAYLVLLNADAYPDSDWLQNIRKGISKYPGSFFASRLIMADQPDRMDGAGDVYHISGLMWRKAHNSPVGKVPNIEAEVFSACGAAAVYPADAFEKVNGFDEDFTSYAEDTDLSFRLRLLGYSCIYLPDATVFHTGSGSTSRRSDLSVYYGHRNLVWTFIKNMPGAWIWALIPLHLIMNLFMILLGASRGQGRVMLRAKVDAVRGVPGMWRKRGQIQATRSVNSISLLRQMDWNPFSPIVKLLNK